MRKRNVGKTLGKRGFRGGVERKGYKVARHGQDRNQADTTMPTVTSAILVEGLRGYLI